MVSFQPFVCLQRFLFGAVIGTLSGWSVRSEAQPSLAMDVSPPLETLGPDAGPVTLTVRHLDDDGRLVGPVQFKLRIRTPEENPWLSTDFPVVESTVLLDQELASTTGEASLSLVLPIRGTYTVEAEARPLADGTDGAGGPVGTVGTVGTDGTDGSRGVDVGGSSTPESLARTWHLTLAEHPHKIQRATWLLVGLGLIGAVCGLLLGREYRLARQAALTLVVGLLGVTFGSQPSWAHGSHAHTKHKSVVSKPTVGGPSIALVTPAPRVGELTSLRIAWPTATEVPKDLVYDLELVRLEDGLSVVHAQLPASNGEVVWQSQLFDGTEYEARVKAILPNLEGESPKNGGEQGNAANQATLTFAVEAVAPPAKSIFKGMALLMGVFALGMATAFFLVAGIGPRRRTEGAPYPA